VLKVFGNPADGDVISIKDGRDRILGERDLEFEVADRGARRFSHRRQELDLDFFQRRITQAAEYRPPESKSPTASRNLERERRIAGRNSGSIWRSAMGYVNLVPRDPSTPLRFAQDDGYYRVSRSDVSRNFVLRSYVLVAVIAIEEGKTSVVRLSSRKPASKTSHQKSAPYSVCTLKSSRVMAGFP
jgi:hypothetical protein